MVDYIKIKEFFDSRASNWDQVVNHNKEKIDLILKITNLKENSVILDVGTGTGILIDSLEQFNPNKIYALDISSKMLEQARKKYDYSNLFLINENFYNCKLHNIDYLICYSGYPHFIDKEEFVKKASEVLNSNGRFVIAHSNNKSLINKAHKDKKTSEISSKLRSAFKEAEVFKKEFHIDIIVDTEELFIISGIKTLN